MLEHGTPERYSNDWHSGEANALLERTAADIRAFLTPFLATPRAAASLMTDGLIRQMHTAYLAALEDQKKKDKKHTDPEALANGVVGEGILQSTLPTMVRLRGRGDYDLLKAEDIPAYPNMTWSIGERGNLTITMPGKKNTSVSTVTEWDAVLARVSEERHHASFVPLDITTSANSLFDRKAERHHGNYTRLMRAIRNGKAHPLLKIRVLNILAGTGSKSLSHFTPKESTEMHYIEIPGRDTVLAVARLLGPDFALSADELRSAAAK